MTRSLLEQLYSSKVLGQTRRHLSQRTQSRSQFQIGMRAPSPLSFPHEACLAMVHGHTRRLRLHMPSGTLRDLVGDHFSLMQGTRHEVR